MVAHLQVADYYFIFIYAGTLRRFHAPDGIVDYRFIEDLVALQDELGLHLANKLNRRHLNWRNMKMKVRLAAQTLSSSVADALSYLAETDNNFKDAKPTINFIRKVIICILHIHLYE